MVNCKGFVLLNNNGSSSVGGLPCILLNRRACFPAPLQTQHCSRPTNRVWLLHQSPVPDLCRMKNRKQHEHREALQCLVHCRTLCFISYVLMRKGGGKQNTACAEPVKVPELRHACSALYVHVRYHHRPNQLQHMFYT